MSARVEKAVVAAGLLGLVGGAFFVIASWTGPRGIAAPGWLTTRFDAAIPFVPDAVWVYVSWYPATAVVLAAKSRTFRRASLAYVIAFTLCATGYLILPITLERATVDPDAGLAEAAMVMLYAVDPPTNLFPSFHAAIAIVLLRLSSTMFLFPIVGLWVIMLCAACVFTRQHYILDVVAGVGVGLASVLLADALLKAVEAEVLTRRNTTVVAERQQNPS